MADIVGTAGDDTLIGEGPSDTITGLGGDDLLIGEGSNSTIFGGAGDDYIEITPGASVVDGGDDFDILGLNEGTGVNNLTVTFTGGGSGTLSSTSGISSTFTSIEEIGTSDLGTLTVTGDGADNDFSLYRVPTSYNFDGGGGTDKLNVFGYDPVANEEFRLTEAEFLELYTIEYFESTNTANVIVNETQETIGTLSNVEVLEFSGGEGASNTVVTLAALSGQSEFVGTQGDDEIIGSSGDDTISGLDGNDIIEGLGGDNTIFGGSGNDYIEISGGMDIVDGGDDYDTIDTRRFEGDDDFTVTFSANSGGVLTAAGGARVVFENTERLQFGTLGTLNVVGDETDNDISIYDPVAFIDFDGGAGEDEIQVDRLTYEDDVTRGLTRTEFDARLRLDLSDPDGAARLYDRETGDLVGIFRNVEQVRFESETGGDKVRVSLNELANNTNIVGTGFDDTLSGTSGDDTISGLDGDDRIFGLGGNDTLFGGDGEDELYGGDGDDFIEVGQNDNSSGGDGDDTFDLSGQTAGWGSYNRPGLGSDTLLGSQVLFDAGEGHDLSYEDLSGIGGVTITVGENGTGTAVSGTAGLVNDTFSHFHYFSGSQDGDTLIGSDADRWEGFRGAGGNDSIDGGGGFDTLDYSDEHYDADTPVAVNVNFDTGIATDVHGDTDTFANIEGVRGTAMNDTFTGTSNQDYVQYRGLGGNDVINGDVDGYDMLDHSRDTAEGGGQGIVADLLAGTVVDAFGDTDTVSNINQVRGTHFGDTMIADDNGVKFRGEGGDDTLTGGAGDDIFVGGSGSNVIEGGGGVDWADYYGDVDDLDISDAAGVVTISGNGENGSFSDTITGVEYFYIDGDTVTLTQIESGASNDADVVDLSASTGDEVVDAGGGNDTVSGGSGNDTITTGSGDDVVTAGAGDDQIVDIAGDDSINGGEGNDVGVALSGNNSFSDAVDTGTAAADRSINDFYCGGYGDDVFASGSGNDLLIGDVGTPHFAGKDRLDGGSGDDVMQAGFNADVFVFADGHGDDTIARIDLQILPGNLSTLTIDDVPLITSEADFEIGIDLLDVSAVSGVTAFGDLTITDGARGAIIDTGEGTITLYDVVAADITADQFIF